MFDTRDGENKFKLGRIPTVSTFVQQLLYSFQVGIAPSDVRID